MCGIIERGDCADGHRDRTRSRASIVLDPSTDSDRDEGCQVGCWEFGWTCVDLWVNFGALR